MISKISISSKRLPLVRSFFSSSPSAYSMTMKAMASSPPYS